jgi:hypothetical protein
MWKSPDVIEYWFDLDAKFMVMSLHNVIKDLEKDISMRIVNIIIEHIAMDEHGNKVYSMIIVKSKNDYNKFSFVEMIKKQLGVQK